MQVKDVKAGQIFQAESPMRKGANAIFIKLAGLGGFNVVNTMTWIHAKINDDEEVDVLGQVGIVRDKNSD